MNPLAALRHHVTGAIMTDSLAWLGAGALCGALILLALLISI
jgi:hypothetical protein